MALTDKTDGSRTILEGRNPVKIAVTVAVKVGDLITAAGALADAPAPSAPQPQLVGFAVPPTEMLASPERMAERYSVSLALAATAAATAANYGRFYVATQRVRVTKISEVHQTAGTDGGAVTLDVERLQGTEALGSGDAPP